MLRQEQAEKENRRVTLPNNVQLAATLRILADAEFLGVALAYKVAFGTVCDILHDPLECWASFYVFKAFLYCDRNCRRWQEG